MKLRFLWFLAVLVIAACATAPKSTEERIALKADAAAALAKAEAADWTLRDLGARPTRMRYFLRSGKELWVSAAHTGKVSSMNRACLSATAI